MAFSKITLNGVTLMDVTQNTVTAPRLWVGETATGADGVEVTGTFDMSPITSQVIAATTSATTSSTFANEFYVLATLQFEGTCTTFTAYAEGRCNESGTWIPLAFIDVEDFVLKEGTAGIKAKGIFDVSIAGITQFRVRVSAVSGGNIKTTAVFSR